MVVVDEEGENVWVYVAGFLFSEVEPVVEVFFVGDVEVCAVVFGGFSVGGFVPC